MVQRSGALANISLQASTQAHCGYRDADFRVFCFDQDWRLDAAAQLELLEILSRPSTIQVTHAYAGQRISEIVAQRPERLLNALIQEAPDAQCSGACLRRVTVQKNTRPRPPMPPVPPAAIAGQEVLP